MELYTVKEERGGTDLLKEKNEQAIFVRYCRLKGIRCVFIPNGFPVGGNVNRYAYINSLKTQGYATGFPDLMVFAQNSNSNILFIEFKREKGGKLSISQQEWQEWLHNMGYNSYVAKGSKEAIEILEKYLYE